MGHLGQKIGHTAQTWKNLNTLEATVRIDPYIL
jgi:hypothetical protein